MEQLTLMQREVYDYICKHIEAHGAAPTIRQVSQKFGWYGTDRAVAQLKAIEAAGLIQRSAIQLSNTKVVGQDDTGWKKLDQCWPKPMNPSGQVQFSRKSDGHSVILTWVVGGDGVTRLVQRGLYTSHPGCSMYGMIEHGYTHWRYVPRAEFLP